MRRMGIFAHLENDPNNLLKKRHAKSYYLISPKLNHTNLHIYGLIVIQYGVNWRKIVAVTFF